MKPTRLIIFVKVKMKVKKRAVENVKKKVVFAKIPFSMLLYS